MRLRLTGYAFFLVLAGRAASAQSMPGVTFDTYTRNTAGTDTATTVAHVTVSAAAVRFEFDKRPQSGHFKGLPIGDHGVVIMRSGGTELIMLDPVKKQYFSFKPLEMMEGARKMMESMGGSVVFDSAASTVHVDNLGPGPTIDGHKTMRYRLTAHTKIKVAMMGEERTVESQLTSESQNATDLTEYASSLAPAAGLRETMQSLVQSVGLPKTFLEQAASAGRKAPGFPLHVERQSTQITSGESRTTSEISDVKNLRRTSIPQSAFDVPADYKLMALPFGRPPPSAPHRN